MKAVQEHPRVAFVSSDSFATRNMTVVHLMSPTCHVSTQQVAGRVSRHWWHVSRLWKC